MGKVKVAKILMKRDGDSFGDAMQRVEEASLAIRKSGYDIIEADNILRDFLGLEPDYMFDILDAS